jgi:tetratricopeptide (TPR) repeat protein
MMEIDQILADLARKRVQFDKIMAQAKKAFEDQSYDMALGKYKEALAILPEETLPQQKIDEINEILAQMANQQERYESLVTQGDQAFAEKEYKSSIQMFQQAAAIYPNETYPPQKIAEAEAALAKIQRELDVAYQKAIDEGDRSFRKKDWDPAKTAYQQASEIKPEELYPKEKLAEINKKLEEELMAQQKEYDRYIADGERFYSTKYYQEAILAFEKALTVFPFEKYPSEMIDKIFELIKKTSMLTLLDGKITLVQNQEEKFKFDPIAFKDRSENYILLEVKRLNPETQVKLFVNFGKGGSQNGGYSIPLKSKDGYHSYFVSIGKQVRWVNQDNDYISIMPEGGDVEVKLIKLSRNGI